VHPDAGYDYRPCRAELVARGLGSVISRQDSDKIDLIEEGRRIVRLWRELHGNQVTASR